MAEYFKNNSKIAFKLFTTACELQESSLLNENILISPFSLQLCLASIYISSASNDDDDDNHDDNKHSTTDILKLLQLSTKTSIDELKEIFSPIFQPTESDFFKLNILNKFYIKNEKIFNNDFIEYFLNGIKTEVNHINFNNIQQNIENINNECSKRTESKISEILTENDFNTIKTASRTPTTHNNSNNNDNTEMIIVNAASLNASWDVSFHGTFNKNFENNYFLISDKEKIQIDMMENTIPFFKYGEFPELNIKIAELQYAGYYENELSMLVLLPNKVQGGINELQNKLEEIDLFEICNKLQERPMWIKFPKFKMKSKFNLFNIFDKLMESNLLNDNIKFSNIISNESEIKINKIMHVSEIESNEIGTDNRELPRHLAICSELPNIVEFFVNRPFIYVIKDKNAIYFIGKFLRPSETS